TEAALCLLDPRSGKLLHRVEPFLMGQGKDQAPSPGRGFVAASADGTTLLTGPARRGRAGLAVWDSDHFWRGRGLWPLVLRRVGGVGMVLFAVLFVVGFNLPGQLLRGWVGHREAIRGLAFRPDGKAVLACGADGALRLWDLATERERLVQ